LRGREGECSSKDSRHLGDPLVSISEGGWNNRERVQSNHMDHDDDDGGGGVGGGESGSLSWENGDGAGSKGGGGGGGGGDRSFCGLSVGTADDEVTSGHVAEAWRWFESVGTPKFWLAPMVGHSDPAFRMLARSYGANICHTEMIDSGGYACNPKYRAQWDFPGKDRPLVVQLGGSNVEHLAAAASLAALHCDAVELNVGCPQRCARKGGYGSYRGLPLLPTPQPPFFYTPYSTRLQQGSDNMQAPAIRRLRPAIAGLSGAWMGWPTFTR
jgi:hypothetical protein